MSQADSVVGHTIYRSVALTLTRIIRFEPCSPAMLASKSASHSGRTMRRIYTLIRGLGLLLVGPALCDTRRRATVNECVPIETSC